jgi:hypothetical protein
VLLALTAPPLVRGREPAVVVPAAATEPIG